MWNEFAMAELEERYCSFFDVIYASRRLGKTIKTIVELPVSFIYFRYWICIVAWSNQKIKQPIYGGILRRVPFGKGKQRVLLVNTCLNVTTEDLMDQRLDLIKCRTGGQMTGARFYFIFLIFLNCTPGGTKLLAQVLQPSSADTWRNVRKMIQPSSSIERKPFFFLSSTHF